MDWSFEQAPRFPRVSHTHHGKVVSAPGKSRISFASNTVQTPVPRAREAAAVPTLFRNTGLRNTRRKQCCLLWTSGASRNKCRTMPCQRRTPSSLELGDRRGWFLQCTPTEPPAACRTRRGATRCAAPKAQQQRAQAWTGAQARPAPAQPVRPVGGQAAWLQEVEGCGAATLPLRGQKPRRWEFTMQQALRRQKRRPAGKP